MTWSRELLENWRERGPLKQTSVRVLAMAAINPAMRDPGISLSDDPTAWPP
jgi:hypothetical protein